MSTQRGNAVRTRPQAHKNSSAFNPDLHKKKAQVKAPISFEFLCGVCKQIIEWRVKYRKYKPLTVPKKCTGCGQKRVNQAYRILCNDCARQRRTCSKCQAPLSEAAAAGEAAAETAREQAELAELLRQFPELGKKAITERVLRSTLRKLEKEEGCECCSSCDEDEDECACGGKCAHHKHASPSGAAPPASAQPALAASAAKSACAVDPPMRGRQDDETNVEDDDDAEEGDEDEGDDCTDGEDEEDPQHEEPTSGSPFPKTKFSEMFKAPPVDFSS